MPIYTSQKSLLFAESVIREMTRVFLARGDSPGVNLAQGFPDFAAPDGMKEAACATIRGNVNQYAVTWGSKSLRNAISEKTQRFYGVRPDPGQLAAAFNNKTRAIILNTPNNPTGKVFSRHELEFISGLCQRWNVTAIMDEIYEHLVYIGKHHRMADIEGMADRTVTISGASKTYSATGWRVGWLIAHPTATDAIRKVHDFLTVGAAAPLQEGVAHALGFPDAYYTDLEARYRLKRNALLAILRAVGFRAHTSQGAYYILTDAASVMDAVERRSGVSFSVPDRTRDSAFAHWMVREIGVAAVPGSSFYGDPQHGSSQIRFCYCKKPETLELAERLLLKLKG